MDLSHSSLHSCTNPSFEDEKNLRVPNKENEDFLTHAEARSTEATAPKKKNFLHKFLLKSYQSEDDKEDKSATFFTKMRNAFLLPPHGEVAFLVLLLLVFALLLAALRATLAESFALSTNAFAIFIIFTLCLLSGFLASTFKLPELLGMLVMGICLRNTQLQFLISGLNPIWASKLRSMAFCIIMLRAGLGLDPEKLMKLKATIFTLAFLPCLSEALVIGTVSHFVLGMPFAWSLMLGFVIGAVSPAVVVPLMIQTQESGLGVQKGIPSLIIAASSIDDILAVTGFTILQGLNFSLESNSSTLLLLLRGIVEIVIGLVYGFFFGLLFWFIPSFDCGDKNILRLILLLLAGFVAMLGSVFWEVPSAGPLGTLVLSFVAGFGWNKMSNSQSKFVSQTLKHFWFVFQPLLFGLIGTEVYLNKIKPSMIGWSLLILACGLFVRILVSNLSVFHSGLTTKERLFVSVAWLPKATVQAAIGPIALDYARANNLSDGIIRYAEYILIIAILSILLTAPIGAISIKSLSSYLLKQPKSKSSIAGLDNEIISQRL